MDVGFIVAIVLFFLLGPWIVAGVAARRARRAAKAAEDSSHLFETRLNDLESITRELRNELAALRARPAAEPALPATRMETQPARAEVIAAPEATPVATPIPQPPPPVATPATATTSVAPAAPPPPPVQPASIGNRKSEIGNLPRVGLEEKLGTNWLNKVGIVLLVLGMAFLLSTLMQTLGPAGKVLIGIAVGGALLVAGVLFEKREQYRILARAGIGGGWALLFFVAYAMNHVAAARVLSSAGLDAVLMLAVAALMVAHTLRYDSQVVTGLAFLLAFGTVTISSLDRVDVYSLTAGVILALAIAIIALRRRWYELEVFGILATLGNHYLWLRPIIEPMGAHHHAFPEFRASALMLFAYWAIFRASYMLRRPDPRLYGPELENVSTVAALLNTGLLLAVMKYQSLHPEWAAWVLLALGAVELICALISRPRRRMAFVVLATVGSSLMVAALPFHYSGTSLSLLWLLEGETLFLAGIFTREIVFRRLGLLVTLPIVVQLIFLNTQRATFAPDPRLGTVFGFAALIFWFDAHVAGRRWPELFKADVDRQALWAVSYAAAFLGLFGCWVALPDAWTSVAWAAIGLLLAIAARRFDIAQLTNQANIFAAAALLRALAVNIEIESALGRVGMRGLTVTAVAALFYLTAPWTSAEGRGRRIPQAYTWAASLLIGLLCWYELQPLNVALAWTLFGLVLFEVGVALGRSDLRFQAYAAFLAGFVRVFFVNLNAIPAPGEISPRLYSTLPLALVFFYAYWRLATLPGDDQRFLRDRRFFAAPLICYFGVGIIAALVRFEIAAEWVIVGWAAMALALSAISWRSGRALFLHQGLLMSAAVLFRALFYNFSEASYFAAAGWNSRSVCVTVAAALLFAALPIAFRLRAAAQAGESIAQRVLRRPEQILWFIPLALVTVLLALEMRKGMITVSWGVEGVIVFLLALWIGERSYRLSGLGLL
ncbi:MAG TPA: DUF2339 domain-containing protein, partial [Ramlibacter sp.]|nr:DUF2339 domain-containing protein [Ramlibacter sp.]